MKRMNLALAIAAVAPLVLSAETPEDGNPLPKLDALQWYNSPALGLEDLRGRAVLVEVFRTW